MYNTKRNCFFILANTKVSEVMYFFLCPDKTYLQIQFVLVLPVYHICLQMYSKYLWVTFVFKMQYKIPVHTSLW